LQARGRLVAAMAPARPTADSGSFRPVARRRDNWPRGVTVSTLDSESSDRGSNLRGAFPDREQSGGSKPRFAMSSASAMGICPQRGCAQQAIARTQARPDILPRSKQETKPAYRVECIGSRSAFDVKRYGARLVPGRGDRPGSPQGTVSFCSSTSRSTSGGPTSLHFSMGGSLG
jgi:hypothetical protein